MTDFLNGISIPIIFRTNKKIRGSSKTLNGTLELFFALVPVELDKVDLIDPGKRSEKAQALYLENNVYGDHRFLVPIKQESIEKYDAPWGQKFSIDMIGGYPTAAAYRESLQLFPCGEENLELFLEKLQIYPFYISIERGMFKLHVKDSSGKYRSLWAQDYSPQCWAGFAHPVITLQYDRGRKHLHRFSDVKWDELLNEMHATLVQKDRDKDAVG